LLYPRCLLIDLFQVIRMNAAANLIIPTALLGIVIVVTLVTTHIYIVIRCNTVTNTIIVIARLLRHKFLAAWMVSEGIRLLLLLA